MRRRIMALLLITTLFVEVTALITIGQYYKSLYESEMKSTLMGYADIIALDLNWSADYPHLAEDYSRAAGNGLRVTFLNGNGDVLADTAASNTAPENHSDRPEVVQAQKSGEGYAKRASKTVGRDMIYVAKKLKNGDIIRLSLPLYNSAAFTVKAVPIAAIVTAALLICAYVAATVLTKRALAPLVRLHGAVSDYLSNKKPFDYENAYPETDEIASAFGKLCARMESHIAEAGAGRRRLELILENIKEGLIIIDGEGDVLIANARALEICGLSSPPEDSHLLYYLRNTALLSEIEAAYASGANKHIDKIDAATGREYRYNLIFVAKNAFLENGGGLFILITDRTEEALAEKVRADFASNVSHELKTPLTSINGYAQLISNGIVTESSAVQKYAAVIEAEANRLIGLINDTLELSKLDAIAVADLERENVDINAIAKDAAAALSDMVAEKCIKINVTGNANIKVNREQFYRLMHNLIENAVKYSKKDGTVEISICSRDGYAIIDVKDDGIGIPEAEIPRIFERFYRASNAGAGAVEGTGLGLAIVKHIAKIYGGDVSVKSSAGKGSVFTVRLKST